MNRSALLGRLAVGLALTLAACGGETGGSPGGAAASSGAPSDPTGDPGGAAAPGAGSPTDPGGTAAPTSSLAADLKFLREEEKLARDVYLTLYETWQLTPHKNIASSEQTHTDRVKALLASFGLPDPVVDDAVGAFVNVELGKLYTDLVASGKQSAVAALEVGATIEDLDIRDLQQMKTRTTDASALSLYAGLECGSRNHLRTYASQLASRGASYTPQYIGKAEYDAIVGSPNEKCGP